jgi:hypothetical protein
MFSILSTIQNLNIQKEIIFPEITFCWLHNVAIVLILGFFFIVVLAGDTL